MLKKTFESWVTVGRGLHTLHLKAERIGGRQTFLRLREQAGLGEKQIQKATVTRLLQIIDNLPVVVSWRQDLTERQQFDWAGPGAIHKHCPVFAKPKDGKAKKKTTAKETTGKLAEQAARIEELEQELEGAREGGGNLRELQRMNGALQSEVEESRAALDHAPKTLEDLRKRSVPLLLALTKEERMSEITDLIRAVGLNIRDWVTTVSLGAAKPKTKKRKARAVREAA
jgi:hypothetical protein